MVCAQNAGTKEGEEKDLIKESEKVSLGQVKRRKKKPWKLMVRPKMRTGTIQRERKEETKEIIAAIPNEDNDDNVIFVIDVISDQEHCQEDPVDFKKDEDLTNESEIEEEHVQVSIEGDNGDNTEEVQVPIEGDNDDDTEELQVPIEGNNDHKLVKDDDTFDFDISDSQLKELGLCEEDMEQLNSEGDKEACPSGQGV